MVTAGSEIWVLAQGPDLATVPPCRPLLHGHRSSIAVRCSLLNGSFRQTHSYGSAQSLLLYR